MQCMMLKVVVQYRHDSSVAGQVCSNSAILWHINPTLKSVDDLPSSGVWHVYVFGVPGFLLS